MVIRIISVFLVLLISGCTNESVTIILSKQNNQQSYRKFIEQIDSTINWRWINAYETPLNILEKELKQADGIIMTGGADIHPGRYSQEGDTIRCGAIDVHRDSIEHILLDHVVNSGIPCLGVCRGLQFMNVYFGGSLHPHLPDTLSTMHRGDDGYATEHKIYLTKNLGALNIQTENISAPVSNHHQGISRLANVMEAWAIAPDGLIEGIRHSDTIRYPFFIGVQWHPERSGISNSLATPLGVGFINAVLNDTSD